MKTKHDFLSVGKTSIVLNDDEIDTEDGTYHFNVQVENGVGDRRSVKGMFVIDMGSGYDD